MSKRVYLQERLPNTPRVGYSSEHQDNKSRSLNDLHYRLQQASRHDDALGATVMPGTKAFLLHGLDSLVHRYSSGHPRS